VLLCSSQDLGFSCRVQFTQSLRSKVGGFVPFTVASGNTDIHPANFLAGREIDREYIGEKLLDRENRQFICVDSRNMPPSSCVVFCYMKALVALKENNSDVMDLSSNWQNSQIRIPLR
jgi:hypothetical protein